jgi:PAS domain S-box-containing protein
MAILSNDNHIDPELENTLPLNKQQSSAPPENNMEIVVLVDAKGIITYISSSISSLLASAPEAIVGCHVRTLLHPDDFEPALWAGSSVEQAVSESQEGEYRLRHKDGSWHWFEGKRMNLLAVPGVGAIACTFRTISQQELAPRLHWSEIYTSKHFVQFYENDAFLIDSVSSFLGTGLETGDACIVIATQEHLLMLEEQLRANGVDLLRASAQDKYIACDVNTGLALFMVHGLPEPERFSQAIGGMIERAAQRGHHIRIFGEMVAQLWVEGKPDAAVRLEELWNNLYRNPYTFSLFCSYPMRCFAGEIYREQFSRICQLHSHVIPDESYTSLAQIDERLRAISSLQQKAGSLVAEIGERKEAEKQLKVSEDRYRRLFETSKDGLLIVDADTHLITDVNPSVTELLGYPREQLLSRDLWHSSIFQSQEISQTAWQEALEQPSSRYDALPLQTRDGQIRYVEFVSNRYRANGHEVIQCSLRDVSERKELDKRKDEFISMASHELKTPVTSLKGFLNLVQRRSMKQGDEKILHYLARMDMQINKLTALINDLLDLSRMQTGKLIYREETFLLDELVREIVANIQETTQTHRLILERQTHATVFGDRERIGQVLINLLNNAIKYSPRADTVLIRMANDQQKILVSIQDFGIGIAQDHHLRIFERFYQVTEPAEKTYPGLGIGLSISSEIVRRHGGQMWVESRKGEGATFHFTLPLTDEGKRRASL